MKDGDQTYHTVTHEIEVSGIGGFGWVFLLGMFFILFFADEIRCSLGNSGACETVIREWKANDIKHSLRGLP